MSIFKTLQRHVGRMPNPMSKATQNLTARIDGADVTRSICPYCAVGCSQLVFTKNGKIVDIEGDPESPINGGTLCPKGSATFGLMHAPDRLKTVKYRAPYSDRWEERSLEWALDRIAQRVKETRDANYVEVDEQGITVNRTTAIGHYGGATLDNEENYLIKKFFTGGLGIVPVENQARI